MGVARGGVMRRGRKMLPPFRLHGEGTRGIPCPAHSPHFHSPISPVHIMIIGAYGRK